VSLGSPRNCAPQVNCTPPLCGEFSVHHSPGHVVCIIRENVSRNLVCWRWILVKEKRLGVLVFLCRLGVPRHWQTNWVQPATIRRRFSFGLGDVDWCRWAGALDRGTRVGARCPQGSRSTGNPGLRCRTSPSGNGPLLRGLARRRGETPRRCPTKQSPPIRRRTGRAARAQDPANQHAVFLRLPASIDRSVIDSPMKGRSRLRSTNRSHHSQRFPTQSAALPRRCCSRPRHQRDPDFGTGPRIAELAELGSTRFAGESEGVPLGAPATMTGWKCGSSSGVSCSSKSASGSPESTWRDSSRSQRSLRGIDRFARIAKHFGITEWINIDPPYKIKVRKHGR